MINMFEKFDFLNKYIEKKLSSVYVSPYFIEQRKMVTNQVVFKVECENDIVAECGYGKADDFLDEEDVIFSITQERNYSAWSNIGGLEVTSHLIDETIREIELVYDEVLYLDSSNASKRFQYLVGVIFITDGKSISVSRDICDGDCLHFDEQIASVADFFSFRELWEDNTSERAFKVKRMMFSYKEHSMKCIDECEFVPSKDLE